MLRDLISNSDFTIWPEISVVMFLAAFVGIFLWTYRRKAVKHYERMGRLALEDGQRAGEAGNE